MRAAAIAVGLLLLPWSGCVVVDPAEDRSCASGPRPFFLVYWSNKDWYGEAAPRNDSLIAIAYDGVVWRYEGLSTEGSGRIRGPDEAFMNVTRAQVKDLLVRTEHYLSSLDYAVNASSKAQAPADKLDHLCDVVHENWTVPVDHSGRGMSCVDGGSYTFRISTPRGSIDRTGGCTSYPTEAAYENQRRIDEAFWALASPNVTAS